MQKKICLLGTFAVGKSSLMERFVKSIFSECYHTTVGVHIQKRTIDLDSGAMDLIIWDLAGEDEFVSLRPAYLRGAGGYILVADGTRRETLSKALEVQKSVGRVLGGLPFVLMVNKTDLRDDWALQDADLDGLTREGWMVSLTSAKTGEGVSDGFIRLATAMGRGQEREMALRSH
jgi:small GTP-binding protein